MAIKVHWAGTRTRGGYTHADVECDSCDEEVSIRSGRYFDLMDRVHEQLRERGWEKLEGVNDKGRTVEWDVCKECLEKEIELEEERREINEEQAQKYGAAPAPEGD